MKVKLEFLLDKLVVFSCSLIDLWAELGVDAVYISDNWGLQDRLMISPKKWHQIFKPRYRKAIYKAHKKGLKVFMPSCGCITDIIPDFINLGLDVLNPIQPGAVDLEFIAREYGGHITFFGGINVQALPYKSPGEIIEEIDRLVELFGGFNGGFILGTANSVVPETPLENIPAMLEACSQYRY